MTSAEAIERSISGWWTPDDDSPRPPEIDDPCPLSSPQSRRLPVIVHHADGSVEHFRPGRAR
jgi:hypothetical protein